MAGDAAGGQAARRQPASGETAASMELAGKLLTVATVLLPVVGVAARAVAMLSTGLNPIPTAAVASIPELALSGLTPTVVLVLTILAAVWGASAVRLRLDRDSRRADEAKEIVKEHGPGGFVAVVATAGFDQLFDQIHLWGTRALAVSFSVALVLLLPGFPVSIAFVAVEWIIILWARAVSKRYTSLFLAGKGADDEKRPSIYPLIAPLLLSLLLASIWAGMAGFGVGMVKGSYEFTTESGVAGGDYVRLAETDSRLYLWPCGDDRSTLVVQADELRTARLAPGLASTAPSLLNRLGGEQVQMGLNARC